MATAAPMAGDREMSIGRVFERAFAAIKTNPGVILGLAFAVGALPALFISILFVQAGFGSPEAFRTGAISPRAFAGAIFLSVLVSLVISAIVQAALTRATVSASEGRKASFGESLATGLRVIIPLVVLAIVSGIGIALGMMLLIVPGIILGLMWAVAVPTLVIERRGVFGSLGRSSELTKGAKWKILGIVLIVWVTYWLVSLIVGVVGLSAYGPTATGLNAMNIIGNVVLGTLINAAWGTVQPAIYVELRQWKEGTSVEALEEVFA
ncbi:MAG TPA: YciC family protein [Sphingomicrobium sp.]